MGGMPPGASIGMTMDGIPAMKDAQGGYMQTNAQMPPPAGWKPSPAAGPALGGPGGVPPPPPAAGMPQQGPPQVGMPPGVGAPQGQPGQQPGGAPQQLPPQWLSIPNAIQAMEKAGVPPDKQYATLMKMKPLIDGQNKQALDQLREEVSLQKSVTEFLRAKREEMKAQKETSEGKTTPAITNAEYAFGKGTSEARSAVGKEVEKAGTPSSTTINVGGLLSDDAKESAARQYNATGQLPAMYRDQKGRAEIMNIAARLKKEEGGDLADLPGERAGFKADASSLMQRQRFVDTGNQFIKNMQKQTDLVERLMTKGAAGGIPVLNKWIQSGRSQIAGDPDVTALDTAIRGLAREHQRIVTGVTSNAQLHVAAQQTADELLNRAQTPQQMQAAIKVMREEAQNAVDAGAAEVKEIRDRMKGGGAKATGGPSPNIDSLLDKYAPK
jgi:hypothetical protein